MSEAKVAKKPIKRKPRAKPAPLEPTLNQLEMTFAHQIIRGKTPEVAAAYLGLPEEQGRSIVGRSAVKRYMAHYQHLFATKMADAEVMLLVRKGITRETLAEGLMDLSNFPPERTRGSIEHQVKAIVETALLLGLKINVEKLPEKVAAMTDAQLAAYDAVATQ